MICIATNYDEPRSLLTAPSIGQNASVGVCAHLPQTMDVGSSTTTNKEKLAEDRD